MSIPVLLIEDTATATERAFKLLGDQFEIYTARNPHQADGVIRDMIARNKTPQVVLTGMTLMDDYTDALPFIEVCRKSFPEMVIIAWSKQSAEVRQLAIDAGANLSLAKYVGDDDMKDQILSLL